MVNLIGFYPFKTAADALSNINSVSEGIVSDDLKLFLETNMPKGKAVLGVSDSKLSSSISDACGIKCSHIGVVPEVYPLIILIRASNGLIRISKLNSLLLRLFEGLDSTSQSW